MNNRTKSSGKPERAVAIWGFVVLLGIMFNLTCAESAIARGDTDLNGDGRTDLLWRNTKTGSTAIWLLNGATIASAGFPGGVPLAWQIAGIGDVDGDGKADVIWRHTTSATVAIWLMNGVTITSVGFPASAPTAWSLQGVGDVNGDGRADMIWRNSNDGNTAIWLMNGTKIATSGFLGKVPLAWQFAGVGDVNGDGKADLIWRNGTSHAVAIWVMNGLTIMASGFPGNASPDVQVAGVGDVNGDGNADLIWHNTNSGDVAVWLLNGTAIASSDILDRLPSQGQIVQLGDADGDGKVDVIWRDTNTGTVVVWLLNGLSVSSDGSPGTTSTDWIIAGRPSPSLPNTPTTVSLTILTSGKGSGSITCNGATCNPTYPSGTALTLLATPEATSLFGGWRGACAAAGTAHTCNFTINANSNVTASFNLPILSVVLAGSGTVTSNPAGIECESTCSASFNKGTSVTLTATGAGFSGWTGGGCAGNGTCVFTLNQNTTITATFNHSGLPCPVEPVLVKDVNPGATSFSTSGNSLVNVNGVLFFRANDGAHGFELWKSDGTEAGTILVKDIGPGVNTAKWLVPQFLTNVNGTLFFVMDDGVHGFELWKSDGTEAGTVLVKDIRPGMDSAFSSLLTDSLVAVNNILFFTANDGVNGVEIWKSDGSEAGTVMVKDIRAGPNGSAPEQLINVNGTLFFVAGDGTNGLWKSDGTEGGTIKIATFNFYPEWLTNVNGTLFFSALHNSIGEVELWKSNGTTAGTVLVRNLNSVSNSWPRWLTNVNGTLFFTAVDFIPITGSFNGLFKSDGTTAGTVLVKEVSSAVDLTRVGNKLYFRDLTPSVGYQPYISDGTKAGTTALKADLFLNSLASEGPWFTDVNGIAFFSANDGITGTELWKSDGTEAGTVLVKDILPGGNSAPQSLTNVDGTLFFIAGSSPGSPGVGRELWLACGM